MVKAGMGKGGRKEEEEEEKRRRRKEEGERDPVTTSPVPAQAPHLECCSSLVSF